ncbi:putative ankyrin repeat domain [Aspergillus flavus AF70]|nr:putative ankyrin repeat domain [Aspergillus flavus AF70]
MKTFPEADVIWWDASSYYVRCPFCEEVHHYGINSKTNRFRISHCEKMETYLCCFPIGDQGQVAYEIYKRRGRCTNICVSPDSDTEDDDADHLAIDLAQKATIAAQRADTYADINDSIRRKLSPSIQGTALSPVERYLETSSEAQLFIPGRDYDGKTTLISAGAKPSSEMVSLLIKHGAEVNAVDKRGRSAFMEAALFGRAENVKILLQNGADKNTRDSDNRMAIDFARDHYKNRRERYERTGGNLISSSNRLPGRHEDTFKRDIDRQDIVRLFSGENRKSKIVFGSPPTLSGFKSYSFTPSPRQDSLVLHGPIDEYPISSSYKTVARLERGGKFPSIGAMSGWAHGSVQSLKVDGRQWTDDVFYISDVAGHVLASHSCDQGKEGRYNACHAEKQLIAYFIDRHVFLPRDAGPDSELEKRIECIEDELQEFLSGTEIGRKVASLRKRKENLKHQIFDGDEKLVGKHDEIKALNLELKSVETALNLLIADSQARPLLKLESQLKVLNKRVDRHADLTEMASAPPPASLVEAVILISSRPCQDCIVFTDKVNKRFGLSIQLFAAL